MSEKGLAAKLSAITLDLQAVPKRGFNENQKYHYATAADIADALRGKLAAAGILYSIRCSGVPTVVDSLTTMPFKISLSDVETGEVMEWDWYGCGSDRGDKGIPKCYTAATKSWMRANFLVPEDDDLEGDTKTDERAAASEATSGKDAAPPRTSGCPKCNSAIRQSKFADAIARGETHYCVDKNCGWKGNWTRLRPSRQGAPTTTGSAGW